MEYSANCSDSAGLVLTTLGSIKSQIWSLPFIFFYLIFLFLVLLQDFHLELDSHLSCFSFLIYTFKFENPSNLSNIPPSFINLLPLPIYIRPFMWKFIGFLSIFEVFRLGSSRYLFQKMTRIFLEFEQNPHFRDSSPEGNAQIHQVSFRFKENSISLFWYSKLYKDRVLSREIFFSGIYHLE